jgi:hypothetical protein
MITKLNEWWQEDKHWLENNESTGFNDKAEYIRQRLLFLISIITHVITFNVNLLNGSSRLLLSAIINELPRYNMPYIASDVVLALIEPGFEMELNTRINSALYSKNKKNIEDAINAIFFIVRLGNSNIDNYICTVSELVATRASSIIYQHLTLISYILKKQSMVITEMILKNIEIGLSHLFVENTIDIKDSDEMIYNKLRTRKIIAELVPQLINYYNLHKIKPPNYLLDWCRVFNCRSEFADIKKCFDDSAYINNVKEENYDANKI